jgi:hypothetical protein
MINITKKCKLLYLNKFKIKLWVDKTLVSQINIKKLYNSVEYYY